MITISKYEYLRAAQTFHWFTADQMKLWFTGSTKRHKRTETMLPRLVRKGKLIPKRFGKKLIYTVPRRKRDRNYEHGIGCTEGLIRFIRSDSNVEVIAERHLSGFFMKPEWGIKYPNNKMILFEFCTADNFLRPGNVKSKITRYKNNLEYINERFEGDGIVLFVNDVSRKVVKDYLKEHLPIGCEFYFTDYQTFKEVEFGDQLKAPIYVSGLDGKEYPLKSHA